jgi:hypothetical protein
MPSENEIVQIAGGRQRPDIRCEIVLCLNNGNRPGRKIQGVFRAGGDSIRTPGDAGPGLIQATGSDT